MVRIAANPHILSLSSHTLLRVLGIIPLEGAAKHNNVTPRDLECSSHAGVEDHASDTGREVLLRHVVLEGAALEHRLEPSGDYHGVQQVLKGHTLKVNQAVPLALVHVVVGIRLPVDSAAVSRGRAVENHVGHGQAPVARRARAVAGRVSLQVQRVQLAWHR